RGDHPAGLMPEKMIHHAGEVVRVVLHWILIVGQIGNLRRIGNPPRVGFGITYWPISNRPQVTKLPHKR
ncbi:MAG TPA: hypothetical protein VIX89_11900, partial [Bryobacteraceae bacterium]